MVKIITDNAPKGQPKRRGRTDAQIEAQVELDAARDADTARRLDTRRKVVIGAAMMAMAEGNADWDKLLSHLKRTLTRPADRQLFPKDFPNG